MKKNSIKCPECHFEIGIQDEGMLSVGWMFDTFK